MQISVIRSQDGNGYYAEVWFAVTGHVEHRTRVYATQEAARRAAERWIRRQLQG